MFFWHHKKIIKELKESHIPMSYMELMVNYIIQLEAHGGKFYHPEINKWNMLGRKQSSPRLIVNVAMHSSQLEAEQGVQAKQDQGIL